MHRDGQTPMGSRAAELNRLKAHFLAAMSHELRTPVNSIIALTDALICTGPGAKHSERAGSIRESCNAIIRISEDMRRFAQISPVNMAEELANFWFMTRFGAQGRISQRSDQPRRKSRYPAPKAKPGASPAA